ncbi:MAG: hypothetical protein M3360_11345 [Actinomycetota bacterium]|nr:hypothetical protein [Actinomycetota bacterium]
MTLMITGRARAWLGALAFSGAVGGHILAYALIAPGEQERAELLQGTGHRLWSVIVALALAALVGGLAGCLTDGASRLRRTASDRALYASTAGRLAGLQVCSFVLLETAERTLAHGHLHLVTGEPAVTLGIVVQVVTALIGAALLVLFQRVVEHLRDRGSHVAARPASLVPISSLHPGRRRLLIGCSNPRGPPLSPRLSA